MGLALANEVRGLAGVGWCEGPRLHEVVRYIYKMVVKEEKWEGEKEWWCRIFCM